MSEYQLAKDAIRQALKAPLENILTLANISQEKQKEIKTHLLNIIIGEGGKTYSVLTEQFVNASEAGIIEPANVPIAALTNAISIIKNLATMEYCLQIVEEGK
jgi:chaperonin GroEL (HSP60 family)